jgi:hypothetical protein
MPAPPPLRFLFDANSAVTRERTFSRGDAEHAESFWKSLNTGLRVCPQATPAMLAPADVLLRTEVPVE